MGHYISLLDVLKVRTAYSGGCSEVSFARCGVLFCSRRDFLLRVIPGQLGKSGYLIHSPYSPIGLNDCMDPTAFEIREWMDHWSLDPAKDFCHMRPGPGWPRMLRLHGRVRIDR